MIVGPCSGQVRKALWRIGVCSEMQAALQRSGGQHTSSRRKSQGPGLGGNTLGMTEGRNARGLGVHMRKRRGVHGVGVSGLDIGALLQGSWYGVCIEPWQLGEVLGEICSGE